MELADYIPDYPDVASHDFYETIFRKKEFYDLRATEPPKEKEGAFFDHQEIIARFISHWTLYTSLFLIHDTGTGKSGSATAVFDGLVQYRPHLRTLYLSNNDTLLENFKTEILRRSPYLQQKWKTVVVDADNFVAQRNRLLRENRISFYTYSKFASMLAKGRTAHVAEYQNSLIILDEVHHLVVHELEKGKVRDTDYHEIHAFLHAVQHKKLLLMTATPMRNSPREIAPLLNLMLPLDRQFPIGDEFEGEYFARNKASILPVLEWKPTMETRFQRAVQGYVSVVKKKVDVRVLYRGFVYPPMKHFPLAAHAMSAHQTLGYEKALEKDTELAKGKKKVEASFYSHAVQASLMVFPDGSYGIKNTQKYFTGAGFTPAFFTESGLRRQASSYEDVEKNLQRVESMSATYAHILRQILLNPHKLFYVYCDKINGSGLWTCVLLLTRCFRYSLLKGSRNFDWKQPARRCIFLNDTGTSTTKTDIPRLIETFNDPRNRFGDYVQVIFGTDKTREGITLKNIGSIHVVSPDWNFGKIYQAIGRGVRMLSHEALGKDVEVDTFFHCAVPSADTTSTVDLLEALSEDDVDSSPSGEEDAVEEEAMEQVAADVAAEKAGAEEEESVAEEKEWDWLDEAVQQEEEVETALTFTPRQLGASIDYYKYIRSELRDYNIKLVEYALLTSAFDCQLNYANNMDRLGVDGSAACMYRPCAYRCDGMTETTPVSLDTTTLDLFYVKDSVGKVIELVRELFSTTFLLPFADVVEQGSLRGFTTQQVVETLHLMMDVPIPLQSRDRRNLYLTRDGDTLFLVADRNVLTWVRDKDFLSSYAKTPCFDTALSFSALSTRLTDFEGFFIPMLEGIVRRRDDEAVRYYSLLSPKAQEEIVKVVVEVLDNPDDASPLATEWVEWALKHLYKGVVVKRAEGWVYLVDKSPAKVVDGQFVFLDQDQEEKQQVVQEEEEQRQEDATTQDHDDPEFVARYITHNPVKRYGYVKDGVFKIRDVSKEQVAKDEKSKTSGMSCTSYRTSEVLSMLWLLGVRFPSSPPPADKKKLVKTYEDVVAASPEALRGKLDKLLKNETSRKTWKEFSEKIETADKDDDAFRFFLFFQPKPMKRDDLCSLLLEKFRQQNLLVKPPRR